MGRIEHKISARITKEHLYEKEIKAIGTEWLSSYVSVEWDWLTWCNVMFFYEVLLFSSLYQVLAYYIWDILLL